MSAAFPSLSQDEISEIIPNKEEISVMRVMTHSGQNVTVFCLDGEPIFFEVEKRIFPTGNYDDQIEWSLTLEFYQQDQS